LEQQSAARDLRKEKEPVRDTAQKGGFQFFHWDRAGVGGVETRIRAREGEQKNRMANQKLGGVGNLKRKKDQGKEKKTMGIGKKKKEENLRTREVKKKQKIPEQTVPKEVGGKVDDVFNRVNKSHM